MNTYQCKNDIINEDERKQLLSQARGCDYYNYTTDKETWPDYKVQTTYWDVEGKDWITEDTDNMFYGLEKK